MARSRKSNIKPTLTVDDKDHYLSGVPKTTIIVHPPTENTSKMKSLFKYSLEDQLAKMAAKIDTMSRRGKDIYKRDKLKPWKEPIGTRYDRLEKMQRRSEERKSLGISHTWKPAAKYTHKNATTLVAALARNSTLRWLYDTSIGTDFSYFDTEKKTWVINLDPRRLLYASRIDSSTIVNEPTDSMVHSTIGAAIHETAHALYTPPEKLEDWLKTYEALATFRVWEDMYINSTILLQKLPGAKPFLQHADLWTNPPVETAETIYDLFKDGQTPAAFEGWVSAMSYLDYNTVWFFDKENVKVPHQTLIDIHNDIWPLREELTAGKTVKIERRAEIYQAIADLMSKIAPPELHNQIECEFTVTEDGATRTPLSQIMSSENQPKLTLGDLLNESGDCHSPEMPGLPEQFISWSKTQNKLIEDAISAGTADIENLIYVEAEINEYPTPQFDQARVDELKNIFKIRYSERRQLVHGEPDGRLSGRKLHKLFRRPAGKNVFKKRPHIDTPKGVLMVLVDGSGSMNGKPYTIASQAGYEMWLATFSNRDYKVIVWNYTGNGKDLDVRGAALADNGELKWPSLHGASTPSYQAVGKAWEFLHNNYPEQKKALLHFTDLGIGDRVVDSDMFEPMEKDETTTFATIGIPGAYDGGDLARSQNKHPRMNIMNHTTENLLEAVQEFVYENLA